MSLKTITPHDRLEQLPFEPTVTSSDFGWSSLRLEDYRNLPASDLKLPPMNHHIIAFHYKPPEGLLKHSCGEKQGESVMALNDITYVPARMDNSWEFGACNPHCLHILIEDSFFTHTALTATDSDPAAIEAIGSFQLRDQRAQMMAQLFHTELYEQGQTGPLYIESLTTAFTIYLLDQHTNRGKKARPQAGRLSKQQLRRVHDLMATCLKDGVSLNQMAAEINLSPYHFARQFKAAMGVAPHQYFLRMRLDEAKRRLLQTPAQSISTVAVQTGFTDQAYLTRQFRNRFGLTPAKFRTKYFRFVKTVPPVTDNVV